MEIIHAFCEIPLFFHDFEYGFKPVSLFKIACEILQILMALQMVISYCHYVLIMLWDCGGINSAQY